ncbi:MAG: N-acetylglucosamine kinase [Chitinophagia bacterium]|nr:N-acetylglucosamine kinase [Chitinophagia bacterium]
MSIKLIAESGATKCDWCLISKGKTRKITTQGISPYFLSKDQIIQLLTKELLPKLGKVIIKEVHFYGTGLSNVNNRKIIRNVLKQLFPGATRSVETDLLAAARALCGRKKGIASILGTGSNSCYYDGKKIVKNSPGIGYILGDEGSGAYLGKKLVQYYLYDTLDKPLKKAFEIRFNINRAILLENVYKKPLANRYLASFAVFLAENRGHYMIENILEDGLHAFFFHHLLTYKESHLFPIHFTGSIAFGFKDVLQELCNHYNLTLGQVMKTPLKGLIQYHS